MKNYIIFCGYAGLKGCVKLAKDYFNELGGRFNKVYLENLISHSRDNGYYGRYLSPIYNERILKKPVDINNIFAGFGNITDVNEGGILKALYDMAKERRCGFEIEIKKISTIQICIEVCEYFGLNIYRLLTKGKIILTEDPLEVCKYLSGNNITARIIGTTTRSPNKIITDKEIVEHVNRSTQDEIYKVVKYEREDIIGN